MIGRREKAAGSRQPRHIAESLSLRSVGSVLAKRRMEALAAEALAKPLSQIADSNAGNEIE
jgi:hypothetical protein